MPAEWISPSANLVNVASFKNVDEEALLKIPGVVYVPMVGKVTVAMLERNLVRLFDQFHHPDLKLKKTVKKESWYGHPLNLYTAIAVTLLVAERLLLKK